MQLKSVLTIILTAFVAVSVGFLIARGVQTGPPGKPATDISQGSTVEPDAVEQVALSPKRLKVYYFRGTARCWSCITIEKYTDEAIRSFFADAMKNGTLEWSVVNTDEPANEHYLNDYQIYTKSVIVTEIRDGIEVRWKNLDKVWNLLDSEQDFKSYIRDEIGKWLEEMQS